MSYHKAGDVYGEHPVLGIDTVCLGCGKKVYEEDVFHSNWKGPTSTVACPVGFYCGPINVALCFNCVRTKDQSALGILIGDSLLSGLSYPLRSESLALQLEDVWDRIRSAARYSLASGLQHELKKTQDELKKLHLLHEAGNP